MSIKKSKDTNLDVSNLQAGQLNFGGADINAPKPENTPDTLPRITQRNSILDQLRSNYDEGEQRGYETLARQGFGTFKDGVFTPTQFLGRLTPAFQRSQMAAREAGLNDIYSQRMNAQRDLRGLQARSGVYGPAAVAQHQRLINQGQLARLQMERQLQEREIDIERDSLQRAAQERMLGIQYAQAMAAQRAQQAEIARALETGQYASNRNMA